MFDLKSSVFWIANCIAVCIGEVGEHTQGIKTQMNTEQFIKSNSVFMRTRLDASDGNFLIGPLNMTSLTPKHRLSKRSTMSASEQQEIVDKHNALRRLEGASDMQILKWNSYLASMADDWSQTCRWEHGQPVRDAATMPYDRVGQNLYTISNGRLDLSSATQDWYDEKSFYNFNTFPKLDEKGCAPGEMCGHYTQLVWADSQEIGCAYSLCGKLSNGFTNAYYLVCNYGPSGNIIGEPIYKKGPACTSCSNPAGAGWCTNGLCNSDCMHPGPMCECAAVCKNCGQLNSDTCSCSCRRGWYGQDCSVVCEDKHTNCSSGWPPLWCNRPIDGTYVRRYCPAMCQLCQSGPPDLNCTSSETSNTPWESTSRNVMLTLLTLLFTLVS